MNNKITPGTRVEFDSDEGPQSGTVEWVITDDVTLAPHAIIHVDHALDGIMWNVELSRLTALPCIEKVAA